LIWRLVYRPEIEEDLVAAVQWYDEKRPGLGKEFLADFFEAIHRIRSNPLVYATASSGLRTCRLKRFAFCVHLVVVDDEIRVVAVMGGGRDDWTLSQRGT
jgi:toxin ParE1/3/4